ncbi:protein FAR1-RELATED SEQUENCE 7-like [Bidens hawaiensis]|uniref:protein FAR1-RELATED SEQUENCE 7-like n=1 Tax=Bidens hawaiensis TaxID=980011 RepID=UPI004049C342
MIGQVFDTPDDAYEFYNGYAFLYGFGIRKCATHKNKTTNEAYLRKYVCNKEGFKDLKCDGSAGEAKKRRRDLRTACEAFIQISKGKDVKWSVDAFTSAHNHKLTASPTKVMKHRSHGKFHRSLVCKSLMLELGEQQKHYKGREFYGLIKHFQDKLLEDRDLYFVVDLFDDGSPRNIFWANGRSRNLYIKFTNKFMMPFAPFFGVNHHRQSVLFASALLENEKQATFEWLFENFLKCMFDKHPLAIITDQDKAIGNAIKRVFPKTRHRFRS